MDENDSNMQGETIIWKIIVFGIPVNISERERDLMIGLRQKSAHITMVEHLGAQGFESVWVFGYLSRTSDGWFIVSYGVPMWNVWGTMFPITEYTLPHDFMYIVRMHCLSMPVSPMMAFWVLFSSLCQAKPKVWQRENGHVAACWKVWGGPFHLRICLGMELRDLCKSLKFFWGGATRSQSNKLCWGCCVA